MTPADEAHREWMRQQLDHAAEYFSLTPVGNHVFGWRDRTIGSRTTNDRWLRVSWSQTKWTEGDWWTGNEAAASIVDVPKPTILGVYDWKVTDDEWGECRNRAEVMTLVETNHALKLKSYRQSLTYLITGGLISETRSTLWLNTTPNGVE